MKHRASVTKRDVFVVLGCVVFVLANLGAVGSGGRRRAKEAVCLSNLKQWGVVWNAHLEDNDGYFAGGPCGGSALMLWPETTQSYYKNAKLRFCPEATRLYDKGGQPPFAAWSAGEPVVYDGSYGTNLWDANSADEKFWRTAYVAGAAFAPLMFDSNWRDVMPEPYDEAPEYDGYWWEPGANEMKRVCVNRHLGAVNMVFLDLSARKIGLKQLWKLKWYRGWPEDYPSPVWPDWMQNFKDY